MPVQHSKSHLDADLDDATKSRLKAGVRDAFQSRIVAARNTLRAQLASAHTSDDQEVAIAVYESTIERLNSAMMELYGEHVKEYRRNADWEGTRRSAAGTSATPYLANAQSSPPPRVPQSVRPITAERKQAAQAWLAESIAWANAAPTTFEERVRVRQERAAWPASFPPAYVSTSGSS